MSQVEGIISGKQQQKFTSFVSNDQKDVKEQSDLKGFLLCFPNVL